MALSIPSRAFWANGHVDARCDATTGHFVRSIAFCEDSRIAASIATALNNQAALRDLLAALVEAAGDPSPELLKRAAALLAQVEAEGGR